MTSNDRSSNDSPSRRELITALGATTIAASLPAEAAQPQGSGDMPYRTFGKSGIKVSAIGLGGSHIGNPKDENEGIRIVRSAVDRGITFLDNCWDYHDGKSEVVMGKALRDGYRQKVFLMTKFDGRTKDATARQIDESLKRLQTDHIDLMQYHENIRLEDPDRFFAQGGPLEALLEAKKAGKIRFIGFTGHKDPVVHLRMLDLAAQHQFHFDSAQMPLNVLDAHFRSFGRNVVPKLVEQGIAVLGMKPLAEGEIPRSGVVSAVDCLHYAMSLPTTVVITGCDTMERLDQALEAARTFKPLSKTQMAALLDKTREIAMTGRLERFKTSNIFDGTARNPQWMG
jgi:aryl-alcohol dehydrogenase-like predicted oxidoreductase